MSNLVDDTEVSVSAGGVLTGHLTSDWEVWGPYGGYVAAMMLRAGRVSGALPRPSSISLSFLRPPKFGAVALNVEALQNGRSAQAQRILLQQEGRNCVAAQLWSVAGSAGIEHDDVRMPKVPSPENLETVDYFDGYVPSECSIWRRFECRPVFAESKWPPKGPVSPVWRAWIRLREPALKDDLWLHACRSLVLLDVLGWASAVRAHAWRDRRPVTPSLDIYAAFHGEEPADDWLLCDGWSPLAQHGLVHWRGQIWSARGKLLASASGQCLHRS